ncbi:MAG: hypothetical protein ACOCRK_07070 [bacterium]
MITEQFKQIIEQYGRKIEISEKILNDSIISEEIKYETKGIKLYEDKEKEIWLSEELKSIKITREEDKEKEIQIIDLLDHSSGVFVF